MTAYWKIGKSIFGACGENDRAAYGKQVLQYISERMTAEFGKGFIYAAKYMPYLPTEEELKRELRLEGFQKLEDV